MRMRFSVHTGASANTLTFQNVTFSTANLGGGELQLTISNALNANGDWAGIHYLESFAINVGGTWTNAHLAGWSTLLGGLSNGNSGAGCDGNGAGVCFYQPSTPATLTNNMVFDIFFTGGTTDFSLPHLKVDFWANNPNQAGCSIALNAGHTSCNSTGDLLSQDIPVSAVPLPAALPLFASGLGALGLLGWRRKRKAQAA
jgi:hypothetical protein